MKDKFIKEVDNHLQRYDQHVDEILNYVLKDELHKYILINKDDLKKQIKIKIEDHNKSILPEDMMRSYVLARLHLETLKLVPTNLITDEFIEDIKNNFVDAMEHLFKGEE